MSREVFRSSIYTNRSEWKRRKSPMVSFRCLNKKSAARSAGTPRAAYDYTINLILDDYFGNVKGEYETFR